MTPTPLTTEAIREMRAAISEDPWMAGIGDRFSDDSDCWIVDSQEGSLVEMTCPTDMEQVNAEFIARSPEIVDFLLAEVERLRITTMEEAAKLVCMYCSGNALGYEPASGPNSAGNYTHESKNKRHLATESRFAGDRDGRVLCVASSIHARLRYEATTKEGT